jgi:hypothetical protein
VERVPPDDRARDEIGPQRGYGGSRPDESETDRWANSRCAGMPQ